MSKVCQMRIQMMLKIGEATRKGNFPMALQKARDQGQKAEKASKN